MCSFSDLIFITNPIIQTVLLFEVNLHTYVPLGNGHQLCLLDLLTLGGS